MGEEIATWAGNVRNHKGTKDTKKKLDEERMMKDENDSSVCHIPPNLHHAAFILSTLCVLCAFVVQSLHDCAGDAFTHDEVKEGY
jgi:hypothetical protein